ncbi:FAD:protein FMN transferase [Rubritalea halochordaticola]
MNRLLPYLGLLVITFLSSMPSSSASEDESIKEYAFPLMGTRFLVRGEGLDEEDVRAAVELGKKINSACSDYDATSELMKLNHWPENQPFALSPILKDVLAEALTISKLTEGAYDPTVGWHTWNWRKSRRDHTLPKLEAIAKAKAATGWNQLVLNSEESTITKLLPNMRIDLGGIAKGYTADRILSLLQQRGIKKASVAAGGDLCLGEAPSGKEGWAVSLKTLDAENKLVPQHLLLSQRGISTSGDIHQWIEIEGKRYSHIVDAATGLGLERRISATVIADKTTWSDALATALCVRPDIMEKLVKEAGIKAWIVLEDENGQNQLIKSSNADN